jgi:YspA, cpYpsA-related SLOG family
VRILVTGGRNWTDENAVRLAIMENIVIDDDGITIVHGGAKGADSIAASFASDMGWSVEAHPANWSEFHRAAGPIRNQEMVDLGADICLAFLMPNSKGTADCVRRAEKAGIKVVKYYA